MWKKIGLSRSADFHSRVVNGLNVDLVSDSSKSLSWLIDAHTWNRRAGLRTADIVIWKEPVDLAYSYWRRSNDPTAWRAAFISYYGRYLDLGLPFIPVRYRDLVADPSGTIGSICSKIGARYAVGQETLWQTTELHHAFGSEGPIRSLSNASAAVATVEPESEFLESWSRVRGDDEVVQGILCTLKERGNHTKGNPAQVKVRRPPWYFKDRGISLYRRFVPR